MTTRGRKLLRLGMTCLAALGLAFTTVACGQAGGDAEAGSNSKSSAGGAPDISGATLTIGSNNPGLEVGWKGSGILDELPYNVEFVLFDTQVGTHTALTTGEIDGSIFAQYTAIQADAGSAEPWTADTVPYVTIGLTENIDYQRHDAFGTVASAGSGITKLTAESVRGKKWTAVPGATNYLILLQTLDHLGLGLDDIEYVELANAEGALALRNDQVDLATGMYSGYFETLQNGGTKLASAHDVGPGSPGGLVATRASLDDPVKGEVWKDFVGRYVDLYYWKLTHPKEAQEVLVDLNKLTPENAAFYWLTYERTILSPVTPKAIENANEVVETALKAGAIPREVDVSILFDDRFTDIIEKRAAEIGYDEAIEKSLQEYADQ